MATIQEVYTELAEALTLYDQHVGWGFFTRISRLYVARSLRQHMRNDNPVEVVLGLIKFAVSVTVDESDTGNLGQSRLHHVLWGNHKPRSQRMHNVYQLTYDWLRTLPEGELRTQVHQRANELLAKDVQPLPVWAVVLRRIGEAFDYNWTSECSIRMKPLPYNNPDASTLSPPSRNELRPPSPKGK